MLTMSSSQNPQKSISPLPLSPTDPNLNVISPTQLHLTLRQVGCAGCELGCQKSIKGPVVYRGDPKSEFMIIGEGPGKDEDKLGLPFTGPAGQLLDKWWKSIGQDTKEWYLGNVIKCRPIAPEGSYKQDLTPTLSQRQKCRPYIIQEINYLKPKLVVLVGKVAAATILPTLEGKSMGSIAGNVYFKEDSTAYFVLYHPAAILHASGYPEQYQALRLATWEHLKCLRDFIEELSND